MDIEFFSPDLVIYHYHPKTHLTWEMILEVYEKTNQLIGYKPCFMCSVIGSGVTIEKEAREKGTSQEMHRYTKAAAIVQNSLAHRILANFVIRVQRPPAPTKAFNKLEDALKWFEKLRKLEQKNHIKDNERKQMIL